MMRYSGRVSFLTRSIRRSFVFTNKRFSSTQTEEEEQNGVDYYIDNRKKVPLGPVPARLTDSPMETKLFYNSVIEGMKDRSPFLDRVKKYSRKNDTVEKSKREELLLKEVDSIFASKLFTQNPNQEEQKDVKEVENDSFSLPFARPVPIDRHFNEIKSKIHQLRLSDFGKFDS